jgi:hypothetical protein
MKDDELANPPDVSRGNGPSAVPGAGSGTHGVGTDDSAGRGSGVRSPDADFFDPSNMTGRAASLSEPPLDDASSGLAPLSLSLIDPPRMLYERAHDPSEQSPILYRERAYLVDNLQSDEELEEQLQAELSAIRGDLRDRDASQYVQLALFDHEFDAEPSAPPIATLSWKDWQGRSEVWVRGVRKSSAPPAHDAAARAADGSLESRPGKTLDADDDDGFEPASESLPLGSGPREELDMAAGEAPKKRSDSGTSWQAPNRSGEYRIPDALEVEGAAPSSQRVLAADELVGALFERMEELVYEGNIADGAAFVRDVIATHIPCDGVLIHVFDAAAREFVVVRALGPSSRDVVALRTVEAGSHLADALRLQTTLELSPVEAPSCAALWAALGVEAALVMCVPVQQKERRLGAIEVGRSAGRGRFSDAERQALGYVAEQFADFVAERPLLVDADAIAPS